MLRRSPYLRPLGLLTILLVLMLTVIAFADCDTRVLCGESFLRWLGLIASELGPEESPQRLADGR